MNDLIIDIIIIALLIKIVFLIFFLIFWKFYFLRNPKRKIPAGNNIVSPADGKIMHVLDSTKKEIIIKKHFGRIKTLTSKVADEFHMISIFMSPLDVHYNRIPIDGKIISIKHSKGKFLAANSLKALENEKNELLLKTKAGNIKVVQIAGLMARRIECFVKKGQTVKKGQVFGRINLGSQAVIIMPKRNIKILVKENQRVKAGLTIVAEIK